MRNEDANFQTGLGANASTRVPLAKLAPNAGAAALGRSVSRRRKRRISDLSAKPLPESDATQTDELWRAVQAAQQRTRIDTKRMRKPIAKKSKIEPAQKKSGKSRQHIGGNVDGLIEEDSAPTSVMDSVADDADSSVTGSTQRGLGPQRASFPLLVLEPRCIFLDDRKTTSRPPHLHFATERPLSDGDYATIPELVHARIWLSLDQQRCDEVSRHYDFMDRMRLSEDQFATFAKHIFFLCEMWRADMSIDRLWRGERLDNFSCPANATDQWYEPPVIVPSQQLARYRWDVRPDCAYWLSNTGFNEEYAEAIPGCCFLYRGWTSNPYLSIEFKKNDWKPGVAATQLLTACSLALFNRVALYAKAAQFLSATASHAEAPAVTSNVGCPPEIRHYGITCEGPHFVVYVMEPHNPALKGAPPRAQRLRSRAKTPASASTAASTDSTATEYLSWWRGCTMTRLAQGDCTKSKDVGRLAGWVNEIHRWGLTVHAAGVQRDVKTCLNAEGIDTSLIDPSVSEIG